LDCIPSIPTPPKEGQEPIALLKPKSMEGRLNFENVKFAYPSRPDINVLDGYTLKIPPGSTTALVGSSGSGKSTVVALLQRFYDVDSGSITIDDNELKDLDVKWLRQHIGYVQQEPQLFGLSVRDNLLYGVPDNEIISQEKMEQACRDANCHDFISSWPDGYDTLVGERGVKLSGGQKQRISIARALITDCRILLLDEATSALDAESEHLVQEAIDKAVLGRTTIIVAHRLSTIQRASQIVVMSNHKIVDIGTHEYLLENCVKYEELIKRQNMNASSSMTALNDLDS
jgi:ABC-type multidrug transport system fused ATPase/permease subunit